LTRLVKDSVRVPVVANGDVTSLDAAIKTREATGVDGVMVARALLENPALFDGFEVTMFEVFRSTFVSCFMLEFI
jgi:tRNA-dihydrouridine synthase 4